MSASDLRGQPYLEIAMSAEFEIALRLRNCANGRIVMSIPLALETHRTLGRVIDYAERQKAAARARTAEGLTAEAAGTDQ